jgi:hypothetical protein
MRHILVVLLATAALFVLLGVAAGPAAADPANKNTLSLTLDCGTLGKIPAVFELSSADSFHVVSTNSNFLWKSLQFETPSGQTGEIDRGIQGSGHAALVSCTYTGPVSGNHYTVTGFFTP